MSKNKVLIRKLRLAVYRTSLWVVISPSIRESIDQVEDEINESLELPEDWKRSVYTFAYSYKDSGATRYLLFLRPNAKPGEVAHETKHILNMIFSWNGIRLTTANDEHECYYLEYLVNRIYTVLGYYKKYIT